MFRIFWGCEKPKKGTALSIVRSVCWKWVASASYRFSKEILWLYLDFLGVLELALSWFNLLEMISLGGGRECLIVESIDKERAIGRSGYSCLCSSSDSYFSTNNTNDRSCIASYFYLRYPRTFYCVPSDDPTDINLPVKTSDPSQTVSLK